MENLREYLIGAEELVPTLTGEIVPYVNVDNAATTPVMQSSWKAVETLVPHYGSVHRGSGHKARLCTAAYEQARETIGTFLGADPHRDTVVFTKNTTEAINKLARAMPMIDGAIVLTTVMEHHSNDLPWRDRARTIHVGACSDGSLDRDHLDRLLTRYGTRVALLVVSGASNVTGVIQPIHELACQVHGVGGRILVDAAQLAPHRQIDMRDHDDPGHLDFVTLSAHKLYAPFGSGALVGRRDGFGAAPHHRGGGTVDAVTLDDIAWAALPDREEAGTPNLFGAVAFAAATRTLEEIGWDRIVSHESTLLWHAMNGLASVPGVRIYGPTGAAAIESKVGVVPFTVEGVDHGLVAAVLGFEHGISVRSGCFCAQPYIAHLLGIDNTETSRRIERVRGGDLRGSPGMVRVSLGLGNDLADVDRVVDAVRTIVEGDVAGEYCCDRHGDWHPTGLRPTAGHGIASGSVWSST
jgi:cysteine desulfurase / selenocysteine lyase